MNNETNALIEELEALRKSCASKALLCAAPILAGIILAFIFPPLIILGVIATIILYFAVYRSSGAEYSRLYKERLVKGLFSQHFDSVNYNPAAGFDERYIEQTGFMMMGNRYHSDDYLTGSYKGVIFRRADVVIEDETTTTDSNGNTQTQTTTMFRGRWIVFDYNKSFDSDLQIIQNRFNYSNTNSGFLNFRSDKRHKVEFENEAFNKNFRCFCEDDQEAFYLITPPVMERIMDYSKTCGGKLMLGFTRNEAHLATHTNKNSLESSLFRSISYKNDIAPIEAEIFAIENFIDVLHLERDIYK